jgi:hypothetical protein
MSNWEIFMAALAATSARTGLSMHEVARQVEAAKRAKRKTRKAVRS